MHAKLFMIALLSTGAVLGACKKKPAVLEISAADDESANTSKELLALSPTYESLGVPAKKNRAPDIKIAIFLSCDQVANTTEASETTNTRIDTTTQTSVATTTAVSTSTATSIADSAPYKPLCPVKGLTLQTDYADGAFLQIIEWLSGYRPGMNKNDLLGPPSDSEPEASLLRITKISDLQSTDESRQISFSGLGPIITKSQVVFDNKESLYHVSIYLGFSGKSYGEAFVKAIAENDITMVQGHYYTTTEISRREHISSPNYAHAFKGLADLAAKPANQRPYRIVLFNGCYSETLETKTINAFAGDASSKIDVIGHRGTNNYRYFAQQTAKLISNLRAQAPWVDILKDFKVNKDQTSKDTAQIIQNLFAINGVPDTIIPILRNNRELIDPKTKLEILFDENGARMGD